MAEGLHHPHALHSDAHQGGDVGPPADQLAQLLWLNAEILGQSAQLCDDTALWLGCGQSWGFGQGKGDDNVL